MAHAFSRGGRRGAPNPRDIVEEAARAAGMSVEQWLDRAHAESRYDDSHRGRSEARSRRGGRDRDKGGLSRSYGGRPDRPPLRADDYSDDRAARIFEDAMETMQQTLHDNEMRTASTLGAIRRSLGHGLPLAPQVDRVRDWKADIEQDFRRPEAEEARSSGPSSLVRQLEERISNVMNRIEKRASGQTLAMAPALQDLRLGTRDLQHQVATLTARLDALIQQGSAQSARAMPQASLDAVERLHDEVVGLVRSPQPPFDHLEILHALQSVDTKVSQLEKTSSAQAPFEQLIKEVASLRASLRENRQAAAPVVDHARFDKQFGALADRLDIIAEKIAMLRASKANDSRGTVSIESALNELKHLIEASHAPADDSRVLSALHSVEERLEAVEQLPDALADRLSRFDTLEQKLDAIQHAPGDIAQRLDQIQSLVTDRREEPAAGISADVENLLRSLAARLETMQAAPAGERVLELLQKDVRALSQKLDLSSSAQPMQPLADIRGLEQLISDLLLRVDGLKADFGVTAEEAIRRAASDVLGQAPDRGPALPAGETAQVQRQLTEIHAAQQEAEKRTSETLGALQETLKWVVERLVEMERETKQQADLALQPQKSPAPPLRQEEPFVNGTARHLQAMVAEAAVSPPHSMVLNPLPPLGAAYRPEAAEQISEGVPAAVASPAARPIDALTVSRIAAMRAKRIGVTLPAAPAPEPSKSTIASAFAAAREAVVRRRSDKGEAAKAAAEAGDDAQFKPDAAIQARASMVKGRPNTGSGSLDMPLEPGSGRPRTRAEESAPYIDPADPKAQFIAAARRAAQTAVRQSGEALQKTGDEVKPGKPAKARKATLSKKHALLLGLAALVVAIGAAFQFMHQPQPPANVGEPAQQNSSSLRPAPERTRVTEAPPAPRPLQVSPRQILPPPTEPMPPALSQAKPDDRVMNLPPRAAQLTTAFQQPEPTTVGSIAAEAGSAQPAPSGTPKAVPPVSSDPLMQFEGIQGSERLKNAARAGDPSAFIELGTRYLEGRGAPRDLKTAALWFERAADFGSAPAQYRLGAMYREGRGVERNARMAIKLFLTSSEAGNARAMHNAAVLLAEGVNGSPDYAGAGEWFKKASEFGVRDSQYNLAILYARGLGVGQDLMASYAWFAAAAASGDEDAAKKRDEVGARLSPEKLKQAKANAEAWKPKTPDPASNEVAVPPGGWDATAKQVPAAAQPGAKPKPNRT
ncbi:MAG: SEL1-like repeat protein [Methylocystis sp.]|nr:SEL1-like repeat protein [Methylocystis sp.]MCA3582723.1 SEL1-like repeat protein [Methylocystis sp.]MCA3587071.1 SEL1-like repeat protein [Methylocystis sp.]MCA3592020.1 SEL1-like repeat protein [Methylocystis sp.]